jgi:SAM-dependent methyltransferase
MDVYPKIRKTCINCKSSNLVEILNLGMHPFADTFISRESIGIQDSAYPLVCDLCSLCRQIQLRVVTEPKNRYVEVDYSYTSSHSNTSRAHWENFANSTIGKFPFDPASWILEVGSNDGYLSSMFQQLGYRCLGVDPSPVMAKLANERNVITEIACFDTTTGEKIIKKQLSKPKLIVANNVFNHANDPRDFAVAIANTLEVGGRFIFELPYWLTSISEGKFDQVYHEHVSYFTVSYAVNLFKSVGMHVIDVDFIDYHGGSIRVVVSHFEEGKDSSKINSFIEREESANLFDPKTYFSFFANICKKRNAFLTKIYQLKLDQKTIVCAGAAAKGNTFLNFYNLSNFEIDFVTDTSPSKVGKFTPITRIPILDDQNLANYEEVYVIILSWNLKEIIIKKLKSINPNITFLDPYSS